MSSRASQPTSVLITGAGRGIGRALALELAERKYRLLLTDLDRAALEQTYAPLIARSAAGDVVVDRLDVTCFEEWQQVLAAAIDRFGRLDVLINNAGVISPGWLHETEASAIDRQIDVNLRGVLYGLRVVGEHMVSQGQGHIINMASLAGIAPATGIGVYSATKHAVRGASLVAALELLPRGVAVTAIEPDLADTQMLDAQLGRHEAELSFTGRRPLRPQEVAAVVVRAMKTRPMEVGLPLDRLLVSKLVNAYPPIAKLLLKPMLRWGRYKMSRLERERKRSKASIEP